MLTQKHLEIVTLSCLAVRSSTFVRCTRRQSKPLQKRSHKLMYMCKYDPVVNHFSHKRGKVNKTLEAQISLAGATQLGVA